MFGCNTSPRAFSRPSNSSFEVFLNSLLSRPYLLQKASVDVTWVLLIGRVITLTSDHPVFVRTVYVTWQAHTPSDRNKMWLMFETLPDMACYSNTYYGKICWERLWTNAMLPYIAFLLIKHSQQLPCSYSTDIYTEHDITFSHTRKQLFLVETHLVMMKFQ